MTVQRHSKIGLLVALFAMAPSFVWIAADGHLWPFDQAWYGEVANDLWFRLTSSPVAWIDGMINLLPSKPPLVSWLGQFLVPLGLLIGDVEFALLLLNVAANVGTLTLLWLYARRVAPMSTALPIAAVFLCASMPLFTGIGHEFVTEPLQTLAIVGAFVVLAHADRLDLPRLVLLLALLAFAGPAAKTTSPAYSGLPLALGVWLAFRRWRSGESAAPRTRGERAAALAVAVFAVLTIAWYADNFNGMMQHVREVMDEGIALNYGHIGDFATKARFWLTALGGGISLWPLAGLAAVGAASVVVVVSGLRLRRRIDLPGVAALLALLHSGLVLVQFMMQIIEETRFITSLMPLMTMVIVYALSKRPLKTLVLPAIALAAAQLIAVHLYAHGRIGLAPATVWLKPLAPDETGRATADALIVATCPKDLAGRYIIVAVEEPAMNANSLAFHAAKLSNVSGFRCYYYGLGYAVDDLQAALDRLEQLNAAAVIVPTPEKIDPNPNYLNQVVAAFAERMRASNIYRPFESPVGGYIVYRRLD